MYTVFSGCKLQTNLLSIFKQKFFKQNYFINNTRLPLHFRIRKAQEYLKKLELYGAYKLLFYTDDDDRETRLNFFVRKLVYKLILI